MTEALTAIGLFLTATSIYFAAYVYRRQMNAQMYLEYTKRFEDLMQKWPEAARAVRVESTDALPDRTEGLSQAVLSYLNLCSEEYYLWKHKFVSKDIWRIWNLEMRQALRSPLYRREWPLLANEFTSYDDFRRFVEDTQSSDLV